MEKDLLKHYVTKDNRCGFSTIFKDYDLEEFVKLSERVDIRDTNNGHSSYLILNGQRVKEDSDNDYVCLLSYIHFLGIEIKSYYEQYHHMHRLEFEYPDVFSYINRTMFRINECVNKCVAEGNRPFPSDIMIALGYGFERLDSYTNNELHDVIHLKLKERGLKVASPIDYDKVARDPDAVLPLDLEEKAYKLKKLLQVSDEEVDERYKTARQKIEYEEVSINEFIDGRKKAPQLSKNIKPKKTS